MTKSYKILLGIIGVAIVFAAIGFFVVGQRIKTPSTQDQTANQETKTDETTPPPPEDTSNNQVATIPSDWKTYTNDKHVYSVQYPSNLKAGSVSSNSVLGTFQVPVHGIHVGPLVLVVLKDADVKKMATDYFDGVYKEAQNPVAPAPGEPTVSCSVDKVTNTHVVDIKSVSCNGEGGAAKYAYITGPSYDVFIDGYSKGYDDANNGELTQVSDYATILSTFIFSTSVSTTTTPSPNPATTPNPNPATPNPVIKQFTISADDSAAIPDEIVVPKDAIAQITFNVAATNVYYAGLDFRSSVVNSGTIKSGQSKTISFTAKNSFEFTPYWPASEVSKLYKIKVTVQ